MKVIHVISQMRRDLGGISRVVQGLAAALESVGVETWILSMKPGEAPWLPGVRHFRAARTHEYFHQVVAVRQLVDEIRPDLVHLHSIWNPDLHAAVDVCRSRRIPYVFSPHGALEPWALHRRRLKKRLAMWLYQRRDLMDASALFATAESEEAHCRQFGFSNDIFVFPVGITVPESLPPRVVAGKGERRLLFLSRIESKKGLVELASAWGMVRPKGWKLEIVGSDEDGSLAKAISVAKEGGFANDFILTGSLDDEKKWEAYARANAFILPTHSENFGIVVAEALYAELPVITTEGAPWRELRTEQCGWWVPDTPDSLAVALRELFALTDEARHAMGVRGRRVVAERYMWPAIAGRMAKAYAIILAKNSSDKFLVR